MKSMKTNSLILDNNGRNHSLRNLQSAYLVVWHYFEILSNTGNAIIILHNFSSNKFAIMLGTNIKIGPAPNKRHYVMVACHLY